MPRALASLLVALLACCGATDHARAQSNANLAGGRVAELASPAGRSATPLQPQPLREEPALEAQLVALERLAQRDPRRARRELAALDVGRLTPRGRLRTELVDAQTAATLYELEPALAIADRALPVARQLDDPLLTAWVQQIRTLVLMELGRTTEGRVALEEALARAEASGDAEMRVTTSLLAADEALRRSDFQRAFARLEKSQQLADADGRPGLRALTAFSRGAMYAQVDDLLAARQAYEVAETGFREDGHAIGEADAARFRAALLIEQKREAEAVEPLQRAVARYEALDDGFGVAAAKDELARALSALGQGERALRLNAEAIAAARAGGGLPLAGMLLTRVKILTRHRAGMGSGPLLEEAAALAREADDLRLNMRLQRTAADAYAALGRWRDAHAALAEHLRLTEKHNEQRLAQQLSAQRGRMETQAMAADLARAQREAEAQRAALAAAERSGRVQTLLTFLIAASALVALYALVRVTRRSRRNSTLAQTDFLTGIQNRRRITELGQGLMARCHERGDPFSVLMLDLDHFKSINDDHGHQAGDRALQAVAAELKRHLRSGDELGRYGGEEFAVVLPATATDRATAIADRLRRAIAALPTAAFGLDRPLTVSIGVAGDGGDGGSADFNALLQQADRALYAAKQAGRNRVLRHDALPPPTADEIAHVARTPHAPTLTLVRPQPQAE